MTEPPPDPGERVLVLAPTTRDAALSRAVLYDAGITCHLCASVPELVREIDGGAAALLITEEALSGGLSLLADALSRQPNWSDLPVLILTRGGVDSAKAASVLERLGNVTLLDRPVRMAILISSIRTALRSRWRQYQLREHLLERERAEQALRHADQRKDEFLAMLAHELRNPLAPIVNAAAVLGLRIDEASSLRRQQSVIERQSRHMARLLDDLLEMSRITEGRIELRRETVELREMVRQAAEDARPDIEERGHQLGISIPEEPLRVDADPSRIQQVLSNLLSNAAKYTPPGGRIEISAALEGPEAVLRVRDTGMGIQAELLPRVFDLFTQAERSLARAEGGLGIGLTMVKWLVEMHGGSVEVRSDGPGKGSEFVVRLPGAAQAVRAPAQEATPQRLRERSRILIIEDNRDAAETLAELLELWGHDVSTRHDAETGLRAAREWRPHVVLLDIGLPEVDGYEAARRLRSDGAAEEGRDGARPVLIAITGYGQQADRRRAEEAGFDHHLTKPVDPAVLQRLLSGARPSLTTA